MAKDPAFLFYSSDFLTGTAFMSDEQVGKYVRLLCLQHQHGHLSEQQIMSICKSYDEAIFEKFTKLEDGKYHNERLHGEVIKRIGYSESRRKNRLSKKDMSNICESYVKHMENENENKDIKEINNNTNTVIHSNKSKSIIYSYDEYFNTWNEFAESKQLSKLREMSNSRISKIKARNINIDLFKKILSMAGESEFLMGATGWKITFDWIFENDKNFNKILEGNYTNAERTRQNIGRYVGDFERGVQDKYENLRFVQG